MLLDQNMQGLYCRNLKRPFMYHMRCGYGQRFLSVTACHTGVNPEFRSGESAQGESRLVWLSWLISCARWYKAESLYTQQRIAKVVQRSTEEHNRRFNNYRWREDLFYYILYSSYCLLHLQNSERSFQNCALRYNFLHAALRCSSFRFKTVICTMICTMMYATERQCLCAVNYLIKMNAV